MDSLTRPLECASQYDGPTDAEIGAALAKPLQPHSTAEKSATAPPPTDLEDWQKARLAYTDAELYRIIVARNLLDGAVESKAEFDAMVRSLGDIEAADKLIAFRAARPGCIASDWGDHFTCACGVSWATDDPGRVAQRNRTSTRSQNRT